MHVVRAFKCVSAVQCSWFNGMSLCNVVGSEGESVQ